MTPSVVALYICGATSNASIAETQQNIKLGIATQLGKSNE